MRRGRISSGPPFEANVTEQREFRTTGRIIAGPSNGLHPMPRPETDMERTHDRRHPHRLTHEDYTDPNYVVFVSIHAAPRRAMFATAACASVILDCVQTGCEIHHLDLIAYCVMPDHIHVVIFTKDGCDVEKYLKGLKWATSRQLHTMGVVGDIWQRSYWDRHHRDDDDVRTMIEYVLDNPVRQGLCRTRDEWPYAAYLRHPGS